MKIILNYDPKENELDHFIWHGPGDPPPLIKPKMVKQRRKGRPPKQRGPDVS